MNERDFYRRQGGEKARKVARAIASLIDHLDADTRDYCSQGGDNGIEYHEIEEHLEQYKNLSKSLKGGQ